MKFVTVNNTMNKYRYLILCSVFISLVFDLTAQTGNLPEGVKIRRIWCDDKYNAFTPLIYFNSTFYRWQIRHIQGNSQITIRRG